MATLAIGDIHGNIRAFESLLEKVSEDISEDDTVVFVGDYIDRGPHTDQVLDRLLAFEAEIPATVVPLMGNHEEMFLRTYYDHTKHSWVLSMEGLATMASYSQEASDFIRSELRRRGTEMMLDPTELPYGQFFDLVPRAHLEFLQNLEDAYCEDGLVVTHAGVSTGFTRIEDESKRFIRWGASDFPDGYTGETRIVYGHKFTNVHDKRRWPVARIVGNTIGIDTIREGVLTAVWHPSGEVVQSKRFRTG